MSALLILALVGAAGKFHAFLQALSSPLTRMSELSQCSLYLQIVSPALQIFSPFSWALVLHLSHFPFNLLSPPIFFVIGAKSREYGKVGLACPLLGPSESVILPPQIFLWKKHA